MAKRHDLFHDTLALALEMADLSARVEYGELGDARAMIPIIERRWTTLKERIGEVVDVSEKIGGTDPD